MGSYKNFCYLVGFLCVVYSSGQAGFCICFYDAEYGNFIYYDVWCLVESVLIFIISLVMVYGLIEERRGLVLLWMITILFTLLTYLSIAAYTFFTVMIILHFEFIFLGIIWKIFLAIAFVFVFKEYLEMEAFD